MNTAPPPLIERRGLWLKLGLSLLPAAGFVWLLGRGGLPLLPTEEALARFDRMTIVWYVLLWSTMYFVRTGRWYFLLAPVQRVPLVTVLRVSCVGLMAVALLPFRMGEAVRPLMIRREGKLTGWAATGTVGAERLIDGFAVSVFLLAALAIASPMDPLPDRIGDLPVHASLVPAAARSAAAVFASSLLVMAVFYWRRAWARRVTEATVGLISLRFARWLASTLEQVAEGLSFLTKPRHTLPFLLGTVLYWALNAATWLLLAHGCGLGELGYFGAAATMGVTALGILVPSTPGFFGAFQLAIYAGLAMYLPPELVMSAGSAFAFFGYVLPMGLSILAGVLAAVALPRAENLAGPATST
ncbi:MAG TPA: lysylphosphatidylglycerol synthase transmembrane domain-containing protein [Polyangiaceae bacterium]